MNTPVKKYRLLKDIISPEKTITAGAIGISYPDKGYVLFLDGTPNVFKYNCRFVEMSTNFFEEVKEEQPLRTNKESDQLERFVNLLPNVKWENELFVRFTWGITAVVGQITILPNHKQLKILPCNHKDDIGCGQGVSVHIKFPRYSEQVVNSNKEGKPLISDEENYKNEIDKIRSGFNESKRMAEERAFNAAREITDAVDSKSFHGHYKQLRHNFINCSKYPTFQNYKNSLPENKPLTTDTEVNIHRGEDWWKEWNPDKTPQTQPKVDVPLFTTFDGVDIPVGNRIPFYEIDWSQWKIFETHFPHFAEPFFSTKQAAEQYILLNKPCLSVKDLCFLYDIWILERKESFTTAVTKEAKKKLNQQ